MKKTIFVFAVMILVGCQSAEVQKKEIDGLKKEIEILKQDKEKNVSIMNPEKENSQLPEIKDLSQSGQIKNDLFEKNKECFAMKDKISQKLAKEKDVVSGKPYSLEQIFYSSKKNSCLYVRYSDITDPTDPSIYFFKKTLYDVLDDGHSSPSLTSCFESRGIEQKKGMSLSDCSSFDEEIEEYKK